MTALLAAVASAAPGNDNFAQRFKLPGGNATGAGDSVAATRERNEPNILGLSDSRSVWYEWTAPVDGLATVAVRANRIDVSPHYDYAPLIGVYSGPADLGSLTVVSEGHYGGSADSLVHLALGGGDATTYTAVQFNATAGTTYYVAIETWYSATYKIYSGYLLPAGFSAAGYFARNQDLAVQFVGEDRDSQAWLHYFHFGLPEERTFDSKFIPLEYLELNPDLKAVFGTSRHLALMHWLTYGHPVEDRIGRVPVGFNVDNYLARYADLAAAFGGITPTAVRNVAVWQHYLDYGVTEGRTDGDFDAANYLAMYPDLAAAFGNDVHMAALHWYFYGRREGRRIPAGFNVANYMSWYSDIGQFYDDDRYGAWLHFRDVGVDEGRIYDDLFRVDEYLALNPDVAAVVGDDRRDAFLHWLYYGQYEGRQGRF